MKQKAIKPSGTQSTGKYQNLLTDFGFKFTFKQERFLISFLNELLQGEEKITSIKLLNTEQLGKTEKDRRAIFDIFCENERGEKILLEMQNLYQKHFLDRSIYYSSHLIQQQAIKGKKDFHLNAMYIIGILNFPPVEMEDDVSPICRSQLVNIETGKVIFKKLNFIYVSLPKFEKDVSECKTLMDRWLYTLIHSQPQYEIDEDFLREDELFSDLLDMIMLDKLTPTEMEEYKTSKLDYEDLAPYMTGHYYLGERNGIKIGEKKGILLGMRQGIQQGVQQGIQQGVQQGIQQGVQQGIQQGVQSTALNALKNGISIDLVSKITNLPVAEIEQLQKQLLSNNSEA